MAIEQTSHNPETVLPVEVQAEKLLQKYPLAKRLKSNFLIGIQRGLLPVRRFLDNPPSFITRFTELLDVSYHEVGHAAGVESQGGSVHRIRITPEGSALGVTHFSLPQRSPLDSMYRFMVSAYASEYGEDLIGQDDHRGCGHDRFMARMYAGIIGFYTRTNPSTVESSAKSAARAHVYGSANWIQTKALQLVGQEL